MINVTKTYLPPLKKYNRYLKKIFKNGWVTNHGPLVCELEDKLKKYLGVKHLYFVSNGTIALQIAIKALDLKNEIITTPFSYIATSSSIIWQGCKPVFVDIDPKTLNIDVKKIPKAINKKTTAILATHVFGNSCEVEKIKKIAKKNNIKLIYDSAHAFGIKYRGKPILNYGDISILSFHATKIFHTIEGGAIVTNNDKLADKIAYMRNFGHKGYDDFWGIGINGKNSEFHAAMGLAVLPDIKKIIRLRKKASESYDRLLNWDKLEKQHILQKNYNYAYYPLIFLSERTLKKVQKALNKKEIFPRRYFYPSLNTVDYIKDIKKQKAPIAEDISKRILCLPLSHDLKDSDIKKISKIINLNL